MKKKNSFVILGFLVAILCLGVGYAAISNITLNINGNVNAKANDDNFKVKFTGTPTTSGVGTTTASITGDLNATINVSELTKKGDKAIAEYEISNVSPDLSAELSATTTNSNTEWFKVNYSLGKTTILKGEKTTITVTVELIKTPIDEPAKEDTINVDITAKPIQPSN